MLANHCFNGSPPPAWVPIIRRATSTIPTQRFATVLDLAHAIRGRHRLRNALRAVGMTLLLCATGFLTFLLVRTVALRDLHARDHVYVSALATSPGDGSRHHPFSTIAAGIRAVNPFGTVTIGPGVYTEHVVLNTKTVHLEAPAGAEQTVVQGHWGAAAITISDQGAHSTVTGFTFTGGGGCALFGDHLITPPYALECYGGGAFCAAPVQFTRCRFTANGHGDGQDALQRTIAGGGVASFDAPVRLRDCLITNNFAEVIGGGLVASGTNACFVIEGGAVVDNVLGPSSATTSCHVGGLALLNATAFVENATLAGNAGEQTGTPYENAKTALRLVNCSVEGGARANGISGFTADYPSRTDYRP